MATKRVIVLERNGARNFRVALWADVPATRQGFYVNAAFTSAWKDITAPELASLRLGAVVERVVELNYPDLTAGQMQTATEVTWAEYQAEVTGYNPWTQYGRYWQGDGSAWVAGGVS